MTRLWRLLAGVVLLVAATRCGSSPSSPTPPASTNPPPATSTCTFVVPDTQRVRAVGADGGETFVEVEAATGCSWTASVTSSFVAVMEGAAAGVGSGQARFRVAPNTDAERSVVASVAGIDVTVTQVPPLPADCRLTIPPTTYVSAAGGNVSVSLDVADNKDCPWSLTLDSSFVEITSPQIGRGSATITLRVDPNPGEARRATLLAGDRGMRIIQEALPENAECVFTVKPTTFDVPAGGKTISAQIEGPIAGCAWQASSNSSFITLSGPGSGSVGGAAQFVVAPNTGVARTGQVTVAGKTLSVRQSGTDVPVPSECYTPFSAEITVEPHDESFTVPGRHQGDCAWTIESRSAFISIPGERSGTGQVVARFDIEPNKSGLARDGLVVVAGYQIRVHQEAWPAREPLPSRSSESGSFLKYEGRLYRSWHLTSPPVKTMNRGHPDHNEVSLSFDGYHHLWFRARSGTELKPGKYLRVPLWNTSPASQDGFSLSSSTVACNSADSDFEIHEAKYGIGSVLERFRATFVTYCNGSPYPVIGEVSFIGAAPVSIPSPSSFSKTTLKFRDQDGDQHTFTEDDGTFDILTDGESGHLWVRQKLGSSNEWNLSLGTATGQLNEQTYEADAYGFLKRPNLGFVWREQGCNMGDGRFRIYDVERSAAGLTRVHLWFEVFCEPYFQPIRGEIYIDR